MSQGQAIGAAKRVSFKAMQAQRKSTTQAK
jgi:hypothetical protein